MAFTTPDEVQIKADILRDIKNVIEAAAIDDDSDFAVRAAAVAAAIEGLYQHQKWIVNQIFPDTADVEIMEVHAALRRITRKQATVASGSITFTGTPAANIPIGTEAKTTDGVAFITTQAGVIGGGGSVDIAAQASLAGVSGNVNSGTALTLTAAPSGVDSQAVIVSMLSGVDLESDSDLLGRLLFVLRNPPASGNKADYERWAKEIAGVDGAFVFPLRRGLGTTDVIITSAGALPSAQLIQEVEDHINEERPCGVNTLTVLAPSEITTNYDIQVQVSGITLATAEALINQAIDNHYASLNPGETLVKSTIELLISGITGVTDRVVNLPAVNVVPTVDANAVEWCRKGTVTVSVMP